MNNKTKRKQKQKQRKQGGSGRARKLQPTSVALSECSSKYAAALADPFGNRALSACLPTFPQLRSLKPAVKAHFTMTCGADGTGFIHVMPTICNNYWIAHYSNAATCAVVPTTTNVTLATAGTTTSSPNSQWASTPFTADNSTSLNARLVACGVRIQYVGKVTDMAGIVHIYSHPSNGDVNELSIDNAASKPQCNTMRVSSKPIIAVIQGINEKEMRFPQSSDTNLNRIYPIGSGTYSPSDGGFRNAVLKIGVVGSTVGAQFYVEIIQHFEVTGPGLGGAGDIGSVDPVGFAAVSSAGTKVKNELAGKSYDSRTYKNYFMGVVRHALTEMIPSEKVVGQTLGRAVLGLGARTGQLAIGL